MGALCFPSFPTFYGISILVCIDDLFCWYGKLAFKSLQLVHAIYFKNIMIVVLADGYHIEIEFEW